MNFIPAITVWQPWASLIAAGVKPYEFRGHDAPGRYHNQRIAIHAGARKVKIDEIADLIMRLEGNEPWTCGLSPALSANLLLEKWHTSPGMLPLRAIVCTVTLGVPRPASTVMNEFGGPIGNDSTRDEHFNWAWPMIDPKPLEPIVYPVSGKQGWWTWNADQT